MLVTVTGFGSVWRRRFDKRGDNPRRFARGVYYNTTGIEISEKIRQRPKITGYARFHACGGFDPHHPSRMIGRVFECAEPCLWQGENKLLFKRTLSAPEKPDGFLVVARSKLNGVLNVGGTDWRSADTWLIATLKADATPPIWQIIQEQSNDFKKTFPGTTTSLIAALREFKTGKPGTGAEGPRPCAVAFGGGVCDTSRGPELPASNVASF